MPVNPTPIYTVEFDGDQFPGYVQGEEQPLSLRRTSQSILNRNGGVLTLHGTEPREVTLDFLILSSLDNGSGLDHLNNCKDQYRTALAIVARAQDRGQLTIGAVTDRYLSAVPVGISAPLRAEESYRQIRYSVQFEADPYFISNTPVTASFSGNGTVNMTLPETRETYPRFEIPSGVTAFTATHAASGKVVDFLRGTVSGAIVVKCGDFEVYKTGTDNDVSVTMQNVNFGIKHTSGAGTFALDVTNFAGSGSVGVEVRPRYEL